MVKNKRTSYIIGLNLDLKVYGFDFTTITFSFAKEWIERCLSIQSMPCQRKMN